MATNAQGQPVADTISGGGAYMPSDNGVNLQGPQGGDYGYDASVKGAGENYADAALGYYGQGNIPGQTQPVSQNAGQAYSSFLSSVPNNASSYYDNAVRNSNNDLNKQMAARGQFGSSNAVGQLSNADTNIRAQQAHDESQYGLQRAQLGGSLAAGADASSLNASRNQLDWSRNQLDWTQGLGDLAFRDQATGQNRFQQNYENTLGMAGTLSGLEGDSYSHEFANDRDNMDDAINAASGGALQNKKNQDDVVARNDAHDKAVLDAGVAIVGAAAGV